MYDGLAQRLELIIGRMGMTEREFLTQCGVSGSALSKARTTGVFTDKSIQKVIARFPDVSGDYLRYGTEPMFYSAGERPAVSMQRPSAASSIPASVPAASQVSGLYERLLKVKDEQLAAKDEEIARLREEIESLKNSKAII